MTIQTPVTLGSSISGATIQSSWTLTTTNAIPAGSLVIVCIQALFNIAQTITSVSDGTNTYTAAVTNAWDASTQLVDAIYYKENAAAVASGATITANFSGPTGAQPSIINAGYVLGMLLTSSLDKTNSGITSAGTAYASGTTGTLSNANEIAFGFIGCYNVNASVSEGAGFTTINTTFEGLGGFFQSRFSFDIVAATTALNYQPSTNLPTFGKALIATFIAAPVIPGSNQSGPIVPNKVRASPLDQSVGLNPNLFKNNFPNNQYDWPTPHSIRRLIVLDSQFNPNLFKNPVPFFNNFESVGRVSNFIPPSNPYNQNLYTIIGVSVPFNQIDWPRTTRLRGAFDQTQAFNPNLQTNSFPHNQTDWAKSFRSPRASIQSPDTLNPNLFTNLFPFNQYDWSRPIRIAGFDELPAIGLNPNVFTNPMPFSVFAQPPSARRSFTSATSGFNPNLSIIVTTVPILNFASTITYRFRIPLPDNSIGFLITRPVTPPPSTTLIQRTLTGVGL